MSVEVHIDWAEQTRRVGLIHSAAHSPTVTFEYAPENATAARAILREVFTAVSG